MQNSRPSRPWVYDLALILVLILGAYFRLIGINWDQSQHLHPDERFLTMVESALQPVGSFSEYFNTATSPLNPHNRGFGFFVYGTLPIFIVRYAAEWMGMTGYDEVNLVGRAASALADLGAVFLLYMVAARLYNRRVALLAAAFSAFAAMQIQQSHFFTVDNFVTLFAMLACYFAVEIMLDETRSESWGGLFRSGLFGYTLGFGLALGMAVASKLNAAPLAGLLPLALFLRHWRGASRPAAEPAPDGPESTPEAEPAPDGLEAAEGQSVAAVAVARPGMVDTALVLLAIGALVSLLAFRIFQPYAFSGPGFFGLMPNEQWVKNIMEQRAQAGGDVDFPPALQWARRSKLFGLENMVIWGLGWPLGALAVAGLALMAWRMLKGGWKTHLLLWGWAAGYFAWQSMEFNPNMRYFLPVYPLFALFAAWAVFQVSGFRVQVPGSKLQVSGSALRVVAGMLGVGVLLATLGWAFAFTRIYTRDHTRVQASQWIYQNVPGPITLSLAQPDGSALKQPISYPYDQVLIKPVPFETTFRARHSGLLTEIILPSVRGAAGTAPATVSFSDLPGGSGYPMTVALLNGDFSAAQNFPRVFAFDAPVDLLAGQVYYLAVSLPESAMPLDMCGRVALNVFGMDGIGQVAVDFPACRLNPGGVVEAVFVAPEGGTLQSISFDFLSAPSASGGASTLFVAVADRISADSPVSTASLVGQVFPLAPQAYSLKLNPPLVVQEGRDYGIRIGVEGAPLKIGHIAPANESSWDDGLPLRMSGYDGYGGIYQQELNFEMYWDDNMDKLERFTSTLDTADYIFISSNRQWATTTRIPERYPLTIAYYRNLIGCPPEQDIIWCYNVARPGQFEGGLGFELVQVFESYPTLGPWEFNDQFAEEAFTVYDHTKVLIFKKSANYSPESVRATLGAVDLSRVIHLTPRKASGYPGDLTLSPAEAALQRAGGTWSELFSYQSLQNQYPLLGLLLWYLALGVLGLAMYPLMRFLLPGLADGGYPLGRLVGLLVLAYFAWAVGSLGGAYSRAVIAAGYGALVLLGAAVAWLNREQLREEMRTRGRAILLAEALFLALFILDLLIRLGNPDLWHPSKGGERPMDFSYLNAVIKSTTFPPFDPWYAGGYINYYYWGFVLVGTPIKLLGLVPSIAYNFVLPTLFAMLGSAGFSVAWNLIEGSRLNGSGADSEPATSQPSNIPAIAGLAAAAGLVLIGNLGTLRAIFRGLQKLAAPSWAAVDGLDAWFYERWAWAAQGLLKVMRGELLPLGRGEWYWQPSRVIPAPGEVEPITEFPLFTFLYSDLHAHMIALPLTALAIAWALSTLMARNLGRTQWIATLAFGGLVIGSLRPTNTWDFPTYLALAALVTFYAVFRYGGSGEPRLGLPPVLWRGLLALTASATLTGFALLLFEPYARSYGLGYSQIERWEGTTTPIWSYLTHWGLFLFILVSWMVWETRQWMAQTPVSGLKKLKPYEFIIEAALIGLAVATFGLWFLFNVQIAWLALPLAFWALVLILRPGQTDIKRLVLFMVGTSLTITLVVEVIRLGGDISRMNTVFKFYMQVWVMFALSAAAALGWMLAEWDEWSASWRNGWQVLATLLVAGALSYTLTATADKINDRTAEGTPFTFDSMEYMRYATYWDQEEMQLSQDYNAIRWLQDNVAGSPVIVEAALPEYRFGSRMTIYTGLPSVLGWNWHQRQQRALLPGEWIFQRSDEVKNFYLTSNPQDARAFLEKYDVQYIIVGQNELVYYPGEGLSKFPALNGALWREVFRDGVTAIYEVLP